MFRRQTEEVSSNFRRLIQATTARGSPHGERPTIVLVARPHGWRPRSVYDVPEEGRIIALETAKIGDPKTYLRHYNSLSMADEGWSWAVLTDAAPRVGKTIRLRSKPEP